MDKSFLVGLVGTVLAVVAFGFTHLKTRAMSALESDVAVLKKQMDLFWRIAEKGLGTVLHSPHRKELDRLIEKNDRRERLTPEELTEFDDLMRELIETRSTPMTPGEEAAMVLYHAMVLSRHKAIEH